MRRILKAVAAGCLLTTLTACGKDVSSLTVVTGVGVDGKPSAYEVTAEAIQLTHSEEESKSILLHAGGYSMTEGLDNTVPMTGRPLHCDHAQVLVIGEETAKQGLAELLTDVLGDNNYPVSLLPAVSEQKASEIMETAPVVGTLGSTELEHLITQGADLCTNPAESASSFYQRVKAPGVEAILPYIALRRNGDTTVREVAGTAVFRDMELKTILDPTESRVLMWMRGSKGGDLVADGRLFSVTRVRRTLTAEAQGGSLRLKLALQTYVPLEERERWSERIAACLEQRCAAVVKKLQAAGCDAVGFGNAMYRRSYTTWKSFKKKWPEHFQGYPIMISVEIESIREGRIETEAADERAAK